VVITGGGGGVGVLASLSIFSLKAGDGGAAADVLRREANVAKFFLNDHLYI